MYVTRTFDYSIVTLSSVSIEENNIVSKPLPPMNIEGEVSKEQALKAARKLYPAENVIITKIETVSELRGMTVEKFLEVSEIMENPRMTKTEAANMTAEEKARRAEVAAKTAATRAENKAK